MGDPVAAVAAESPAIAKQALKKIKVVYEPLPVAIDPEEATKPEAPTLHEDMPLPKTFADAKQLFAAMPSSYRRCRKSDGRSGCRGR